MIHSKVPPEAAIKSVGHRVAEKHPEAFAEYKVFDRLARERMMAMLSGFLVVLAAVLTMVGLYGCHRLYRHPAPQ
jgi:hypothetical protein